MGVILTIKNTDNKKSLENKIKKLKKISTGFPAHRFKGKIKFNDDPVESQRKMRNDWE